MLVKRAIPQYNSTEEQGSLRASSGSCIAIVFLALVRRYQPEAGSMADTCPANILDTHSLRIRLASALFSGVGDLDVLLHCPLLMAWSSNSFYIGSERVLI